MVLAVQEMLPILIEEGIGPACLLGLPACLALTHESEPHMESGSLQNSGCDSRVVGRETLNTLLVEVVLGDDRVLPRPIQRG